MLAFVADLNAQTIQETVQPQVTILPAQQITPVQQVAPVQQLTPVAPVVNTQPAMSTVYAQTDDFKYNISFDPISMILGFYSVTGSYAFHPNIAVKGNIGFNIEPFGEEDQSGFGAQIAAGIYLDRVYHGFFFEPGLGVYTVKDDKINKSAVAFGPQTLLGYHWTWDSGLNIALAAGVQRNFTSEDDPAFNNFNEFRFAGFFRLGYAFNLN